MQGSVERKPDMRILRQLGKVQGDALQILEFLGFYAAEGAHVDLDMKGAARRRGELELDAVDFRAVGLDRTKTVRNGADGVIRRRLENVEFCVGERRFRRGERRGGIGSANHIGEIPPLGVVLEKLLGGESRPRLVDVVEHDDAIRPNDSGRAQEVEQREFELMVAVDQHHVVEHAVADRPSK